MQPQKIARATLHVCEDYCTDKRENNIDDRLSMSSGNNRTLMTSLATCC